MAHELVNHRKQEVACVVGDTEMKDMEVMSTLRGLGSRAGWVETWEHVSLITQRIWTQCASLVILLRKHTSFSFHMDGNLYYNNFYMLNASEIWLNLKMYTFPIGYLGQ